MRSTLLTALACGQLFAITEAPSFVHETSAPYHSYAEYSRAQKRNSSAWYKAGGTAAVVVGVLAFETLYGGAEFGPGSISPKTVLTAAAAGAATYFILDLYSFP